MNTEKINTAIAELSTGKYKTSCLHWAIRVGKSVGLQTFLRTSTFDVSRVLLVGYNPQETSERYGEKLGVAITGVEDLNGIEDGKYDCILFDDIEWTAESYAQGLAMYDRALEVVGDDGYVVVAGTQRYGICDTLKNRVSFYSKITTPEVHPDFLEEHKDRLEDPTFQRDYLLIKTVEEL
tara:strand:- start:2877 stop:3416 length:540 start_codon:yes stop_codon:yes gene_type:complete